VRGKPTASNEDGNENHREQRSLLRQSGKMRLIRQLFAANWKSAINYICN
jgi:hypothetical protein